MRFAVASRKQGRKNLGTSLDRVEGLGSPVAAAELRAFAPAGPTAPVNAGVTRA